MKHEISELFEEAYKKKIDENRRLKSRLLEIKDEIEDSFSKDKITELHHNLLTERILRLSSDNRVVGTSG